MALSLSMARSLSLSMALPQQRRRRPLGVALQAPDTPGGPKFAFVKYLRRCEAR